jgi:hypothetical protein
VNIEIPAHRAEECIKEVGIGFLFAPMMHLAMKYAIGPRREIGIRTIFNVLGPLTNPAKVTSQVMGVYAADLTTLLARALGNLGTTHAFVVHGMDGLDEITITDRTKVSEFKNGRSRTISSILRLRSCRMNGRSRAAMQRERSHHDRCVERAKRPTPRYRSVERGRRRCSRAGDGPQGRRSCRSLHRFRRCHEQVGTTQSFTNKPIGLLIAECEYT